MVEAKIVSSKTEVRRLIEQGGVKVDDTVIKDIDYEIEPNGQIVQIGKRRFLKVI